MHEAVFEAGWAADALMPHHRAVIAGAHRGCGREVISLDWTYAHHERGPKIWGVKKAWDHVQQRLAPYQTVVTAVLANRARLDGIEVLVQQPSRQDEELAYLQETGRASYTQLEEARERVLELLHHRVHGLGYKKRTELALDIVQQLEQEGHFPSAHYAFDHGVLSLELSRGIERAGKHWVSELECSRHIQWQGQWQRVDIRRPTRCGRRIQKVFVPCGCTVAMGRRNCFGSLRRSSGSNAMDASVWSSCTNSRLSGILRAFC
jgi:hypothetical protein